MCGLAGTYAPNGGPVSQEVLLSMAGELRHRGPDETGLYLSHSFGMVNTRLAISDPEHGSQPLGSEDGRVWVMQSGEIYNHVELRRELEGRGHRFTTACDTEVLVHGYEEWGSECLTWLNGDFALAIWDRSTQELFLARDRFGARPLFLAEFGGDLSFASEIKALLRHPKADRELDPAGIVDAFTLWSIAPQRSAFQGVRELPPGYFLRIGPAGAIEYERWWDISFPREEVGPTRHRDEELAEELLRLLDDATRLRLRADVSVGAYLSGGMDSSTVTALATREKPRDLTAFGVVFDDPLFDESEYQVLAARALGVELVQITAGTADIGRVFPEVVRLAEQPTLRTAPAPLLLLSAEVHRAGLKVILTGEGADELLAGYDLFLEDKVRRFWAREPESRVRPTLLERLHPFLARDPTASGALLHAFYRRGLEETSDLLYSHRIRFANTSRCLRLLDREFTAGAAAEGDCLERLVARLPDEYRSFGALGRAQYLEIATFLTGYLLHAQGDRMLMGNSVEGRFPFLDHRVAEFAMAVPDRSRLRGLRQKPLLRKATKRLLPAPIHQRRKVPYRAPIVQAFVGRAAPEYVRDLLRPNRLAEAGIFDPSLAQAVVAKCERQADTGVAETEEMALVGIVSAMLLHEQFIARPVLAAPLTPQRRIVEDAQAIPQPASI